MHLLITQINWDTDDVPVDECALPSHILVLDVPVDADEDYVQGPVSDAISDTFGFCHRGFMSAPFSPDDFKTHAGGGFFPGGFGGNLGVIVAPEKD